MRLCMHLLSAYNRKQKRNDFQFKLPGVLKNWGMGNRGSTVSKWGFLKYSNKNHCSLPM